ncbi:MAG: hypothetical protein GSR85_03155 [Desulfurococcales archaeon]|nr:hypothetical protein [Desulfurococcales archaeon]
MGLKPEEPPILILCEGDNDYRFLQGIVKRKLYRLNYRFKDKVIRSIYRDKGVFTVVEEGKERLIKNLRILLSKLRSIRKHLVVVALIDSNYDKPEHITERLLSSLRSVSENKAKFPKRKPTVRLESQRGRYHYIIMIEYPTGIHVRLHLIVIDHSLEYWLDRAKDNPGILEDSEWYKNLVKLLEEVKLI